MTVSTERKRSFYNTDSSLYLTNPASINDFNLHTRVTAWMSSIISVLLAGNKEQCEI